MRSLQPMLSMQWKPRAIKATLVSFERLYQSQTQGFEQKLQIFFYFVESSVFFGTQERLLCYALEIWDEKIQNSKYLF